MYQRLLAIAIVFLMSAAAARADYQFQDAPTLVGPIAAQRTDIVVPDGVWDKAGKLFVLPVFVVASDRGQLAEDPDNPGYDFNGNAIHASTLAAFERAKANMGAHLQMSRRMYHRMLRNPLNGAPRGTFGLATWRHDSGRAASVSDYNQTVRPLVVQVPHSAGSIASQLGSGILSFIDNVMDQIGCRQTSCPLVLMMVIVGDTGIGTGAYKFNQGFNSGAGFGVFRWTDVRDANFGDAACSRIPRLTGRPPQDNWAANGCNHFQSTLVHEIGHAYGLNHSWEYGGAGSYYDEKSSASIMSYNVQNWIPGCGYGNAAADNMTACTYPDSHDTIDDHSATWPGALLADDVRVLARNRQGFADIDYARALDAPGGTQKVLHQTYNGTAEIPGQKRLYITPGLTAEGYPDSIIGGGSEAVLQAWEPWNPRRLWTLGPFAPGFTSFFQAIFPGPVRLTTVRFYTAHGGEQHVTGTFYNKVAEARVGCSGCLDGGFDVLGSTTFASGLNASASLQSHSPTDSYRIDLKHETSYVTLRGVRFWGQINGSGPEVELFPAAEPQASTSFATWDGNIEAIVGSNQTIKAFADSFSPADSWHSQAVECGSWVPIEVEFPDDVELGYVKVHSGHSGQYHVPDLVQIERQCVCRNSNSGDGGVCDAGLSQTQCAAAGGPGHSVFEFVDREAVDADHLLGFAATSAHRWKVALRTPEAPGQCYSVVRGLRFFSPEGHELFPARSRPPGE